MCIMNQKNLGIIGIIIAVGIIILFTYQTSPEVEKPSLDSLLELSLIELEEVSSSSDKWKIFSSNKYELFYVYFDKNKFRLGPDGVKIVESFNYVPKKELKKTYEEIGLFNESQSTVVIVPTFTVNAYSEPGFYNYYYNICDKKCLTVSIQDRTFGYTSSKSGVDILKFLQYEMITDVDVDKNPDILKNYDKVIVLHNEYVTKTEFDAITSHPKVIYLYPNALYAEINVDYQTNTMTLIRGHSYPESNISNGFDWEYDNSSMEIDCTKWEFYEISNGFMLNCYPELGPLLNDQEFYKKLKDL